MVLPTSYGLPEEGDWWMHTTAVPSPIVVWVCGYHTADAILKGYRLLMRDEALCHEVLEE